ncbi:MAG: hypothetical protein JSS83_10920 [Cyanobacteria bacterium SZAS LIN-3]|nr:hypothetical protein [Cyanobacteria bacterium SZAS LIN-3]MBS2006026.1 hypothetical protein [Cyanobacteria bacterium SZAS TMP-1]
MNSNMNAYLTLGALLCLSAFALPAVAWDFHSHRHIVLTSDSRLNREICRDRHRAVENSRQVKADNAAKSSHGHQAGRSGR